MGMWSELSRQGSAEAAFGIGLLYDLGNGTREDPDAALFWYSIAARAGYAPAQFNVATMYDSGRGVAPDRADAALWYAKAAAHGHHRAQFDLAQLYEQGDGVPLNLDAAAAWYRAAAQGGIAAAGDHLKSVQAAMQKDPGKRQGGQLVRVGAASPAKNATVALPAEDPAVELVWVAPVEPQPVFYEVWVAELGDKLRTVFTASVAETAVLVKLPATAGFYVWHVDAVGADGTHIAGDWSWFSVNPSAATRSVASAREPPSLNH
jgi:TPR repeat protein